MFKREVQSKNEGIETKKLNFSMIFLGVNNSHCQSTVNLYIFVYFFLGQGSLKRRIFYTCSNVFKQPFFNLCK